MTACRTPQSSAQRPSKTPSRVGVKRSSFVLPGIASRFPVSSGTHQLWLTSKETSSSVTGRSTGSDEPCRSRSARPDRRTASRTGAPAPRRRARSSGRRPSPRPPGVRASTTAAMPTRITAGMAVQMISSRVLPWICGPSASSAVVPPAAEADDEEDERGLDGDEHDGADGEHEPVELADRLAARRRGLRRARSRRSPVLWPRAAGTTPSASTARAAAMTAGFLLPMGRCDSIRLGGSRASPPMSPVRGSCNSPVMWFSECQRDTLLSGKRVSRNGTAGSWERFSRAEGRDHLGEPCFPQDPLLTGTSLGVCRTSRGPFRSPPE